MGNSSISMPRGIEVLIKKASVDSAFREILLKEPVAAAAEIGLELSTAEIAVLNSLPRPQVEQIIDHTAVPDEHRRVFLGKIAAAMLALITLPVPTSAWEFAMTGHTVYDRGGANRSELPRRPIPNRPIKMNTVRVPPQCERLNVQISDTEENTVTVKVNYDCPFDTGEIMVICGRDRGQEGKAVTCRPLRITASKGTGEAVFSVEGKGAATQGILVRLYSTTNQRERTLSGFLTPPALEEALPGFQPGEYEVDYCAIYKVVEFHKVWPS